MVVVKDDSKFSDIPLIERWDLCTLPLKLGVSWKSKTDVGKYNSVMVKFRLWIPIWDLTVSLSKFSNNFLLLFSHL